MKNTIHSAVGIIAALSLLLGLSLGQLHDQYQTLRKTRSSSFPELDVRPFVRSGCGWNRPMHHRHRAFHHTIEQLPSRIDMEHAILNAEKDRIRQEIERIQLEMEQQPMPQFLREEQ